MYLVRVMCLVICACAVALPTIAAGQPSPVVHNGGVRAVTILTEDAATIEEKATNNEDDDNDDNDLSDITFHDSDDDDEDGADFVDQRQNGTENYRIRVSGLLLVVASPEMAMPELPSTTETILKPPTAPPTANNTLSSRGGIKRRINVRRHGPNMAEERKRKLSRYQTRIPELIRAILRKYRKQQ